VAFDVEAYPGRWMVGFYSPDPAIGHFTIEDPGAFTTPWTAIMIYLRDRAAFPEQVCAEGRLGFHNDEGVQIPTAAKPDF